MSFMIYHRALLRIHGAYDHQDNQTHKVSNEQSHIRIQEAGQTAHKGYRSDCAA